VTLRGEAESLPTTRPTLSVTGFRDAEEFVADSSLKARTPLNFNLQERGDEEREQQIRVELV
jgi:hypothetical protein